MERPNRVKEIRRLRKLTALEVARAVDVRETTVYRWESGDARPSLATAFALAEVLGSSIDELFPRREQVPA